MMPLSARLVPLPSVEVCATTVLSLVAPMIVARSMAETVAESAVIVALRI